MQHLIGKTVKFLNKIEQMEVNADPNQRARILSITGEYLDSEDKHDHVYIVTFDYSEFEEYNKNFASANFYDKNGNPTLTAHEAGVYKQHEKAYFGSPDIWPFENYFTLLDDKTSALIEKFKQSGETDYVVWLENQVAV